MKIASIKKAYGFVECPIYRAYGSGASLLLDGRVTKASFLLFAPQFCL